MRKLLSGVLCLVVLLVPLFSMTGAAAQGGYSSPSTNLPDPLPYYSSYWQTSSLVNKMSTRSGPGGNNIYTEELASFRLGIEIAENAVVLVGWKEPSTPYLISKTVNEIYWAMVEFTDINGNLYRAYVEIDSPTKKAIPQKLSINPDTVPYEKFTKVDCEVYGSATRLYYGPGTEYKVVTVRNNYRDTGKEILLPAGTNVQFICSERNAASGRNYALIEFTYPSSLKSPSEDSGPLMRAWAPMDAIRRK